MVIVVDLAAKLRENKLSSSWTKTLHRAKLPPNSESVKEWSKEGFWNLDHLLEQDTMT